MATAAHVWEDIVEQNRDYVYNLAYYLSRDSFAADDLTQETFLKAFENLDSFREESSIRTWLCSIAVNAYKMSHRRNYNHKSMCLEVMTPPEKSIDPERIIIRKELQWCVHHVLQHHVSRDYKVILVLRDLNDMSYEEIAEVLDISVPAVKSRLHRARMAFRKHLEKSGCAKLMKDYTCYCEGVMLA